MGAVKRYDTCEFSSPTRLDNGYLRCDARITRTGVFSYQLADGTKRRELRLPEEVFKADSLATFRDVPLTNNHPPARLTSKNTRKYQIGLVNDIKQDESFITAKVLVTDEDSIALAENGKRELSCGYYCDVEIVSGVTQGVAGVTDGTHYDAIQRNIRGNHVALVSKGRAGGDASLHLDAAGHEVFTGQHKNDDDPTLDNKSRRHSMNYRIDGVDFEVDQQLSQALDKRQEKHDAQTKALKDQVSEQTARADAAEEKAKALGEERGDEAIAKIVASRVALQTTAAQILKSDDGKDLKLDEMSDADIRKAVIVKVHPAAAEKLDGADDAYITARFDAALEAHADKLKVDADDATKRGNNSVKDKSTKGSDRHDSSTARAAMINDQTNAWKPRAQA